MDNVAVLCKNIRKTYGTNENRVEALQGVDLNIMQGELHLLMGPSGSGKTTLISIIAGILTQDSGDCFVNNIPLNHLPNGEKAHYRGKNIGFVFQAFNLIPTLTNEENISVPLVINGVKKKEAIEKSKEMMRELGLVGKIGISPSQLSGGQQQRIAIARALIHDPQIIVCDEPTSFLDHEAGHKIMELLQGIARKRNVTVIVVTHDPRVMKYADKIDQLEDGKIIPNIMNKVHMDDSESSRS